MVHCFRIPASHKLHPSVGSHVRSTTYLVLRCLQAEAVLRRVRASFPGARVMASTLDAFIVPLYRAVRNGLQLPVVTGEIGDT